MYLQNKYTKCYYSIIDRAKSRDLPKEVYIERHHIIPKSLGGSNEQNNLVTLTPREHFICHLLLPRMLTGVNKRNMTFAIWSMMNRDHSKQRARHKVNSHVYQRLKNQIAIAISESNKGRKRTPEFCQRIRDIKLGVPNTAISGDKHYTQRTGYVSKISGENHYNYGKKQSHESNQKRKDTITGTKRSELTKQKQSEARKAYWARKRAES
jgi:hypothetical protein